MRENKIMECLRETIVKFQNKKENIDKYGCVIPFVKKSINIEVAVKRAFKSVDKNGKMDQHQYRVGKKVLKQAHKKFLKLKLIAKLENCKDFECIYNLVRHARTKHFGKLAIYDVALRIGLFLKKEPNYVCLAGNGPFKAYKIISNNRLVKHSRIDSIIIVATYMNYFQI